jgi:ribosomal protein L24
MNVTTDNFINNILLEGLYLSLLVCFLAINIYRQQILIKEIACLKKKQDILFESIQKLKIIIDIDKETEDIVSANVAILQNKLNDIEKRIEKECLEDRGVRGLGTQVPVEESYVDKYRVNPVEDMGSPHCSKYLDPDLKKLFGIFSDDDNETTADTLSTYLEPQSYLEPQFSFEKFN